jgi:hypothetical protein
LLVETLQARFASIDPVLGKYDTLSLSLLLCRKCPCHPWVLNQLAALFSPKYNQPWCPTVGVRKTPACGVNTMALVLFAHFLSIVYDCQFRSFLEWRLRINWLVGLLLIPIGIGCQILRPKTRPSDRRSPITLCRKEVTNISERPSNETVSLRFRTLKAARARKMPLCVCLCIRTISRSVSKVMTTHPSLQVPVRSIWISDRDAEKISQAAMNIAAITGPITKPLRPKIAIPPSVEISTT